MGIQTEIINISVTMDGKTFKKIVSRIPDDAQIVRLCEKYIAWRLPGQLSSVFSFHPEKLNEEV